MGRLPEAGRVPARKSWNAGWLRGHAVSRGVPRAGHRGTAGTRSGFATGHVHRRGARGPGGRSPREGPRKLRGVTGTGRSVRQAGGSVGFRSGVGASMGQGRKGAQPAWSRLGPGAVSGPVTWARPSRGGGARRAGGERSDDVRNAWPSGGEASWGRETGLRGAGRRNASARRLIGALGGGLQARGGSVALFGTIFVCETGSRGPWRRHRDAISAARGAGRRNARGPGAPSEGPAWAARSMAPAWAAWGGQEEVGWGAVASGEAAGAAQGRERARAFGV